MQRLICGAALLSLVFWAALAQADVLLDMTETFEARAQPRLFPFEIPAPGGTAVLKVSVQVQQGTAIISVIDPNGKEIYKASCGSEMTLGHQPLNSDSGPGVYQVALINESGTAHWSVQVVGGPDRSFLYLTAMSGVGMMLVGAGAVLIWRYISHVRWRWFWAGAAVWTLGVALKFAWAIPLNPPILGALKAQLPNPAYVIARSVYIGLLTGVFEIGTTLLAALIWRRMAADWARGGAIGVGAGAVEAMLLGFVSAVTALITVYRPDPTVSAAMLAAQTAASATPVFWLVSIVERLLAISCHTSSRALVLYGVARQCWWPFWAGFLLLSAVDTIAGFVLVSGIAGQLNLWWIELAILPAAAVSVPIVSWCVQKWPKPATEQTESDAAASKAEGSGSRV